MCGIVGFTSRNKSAVGPLVNGLRRLEYRGYDSAGVALESAEGIKVYKQTGKVAKLDNLLSRALPENERGKYTIGIAHTRWATHGLPTVANAHPHVADGGSLALVHNGIIENYAALRAGLEKRGVKFLSQTDTEVVAHLIAAFDKGDLLAAAAEALRLASPLNKASSRARSSRRCKNISNTNRVHPQPAAATMTAVKSSR